jgi:hypothetical protein
MKRKIFTTLALVCCIMVCFAIAADLAGKWSGTVKTPDGNEFPLTYTFKTDSGKLTGSVQSPQGEVTITEGKLSGNDFSFNVSANGMDIKHTGKFYPEADSVGLDIDFGGQKMHTTLKRATGK